MKRYLTRKSGGVSSRSSSSRSSSSNDDSIEAGQRRMATLVDEISDENGVNLTEAWRLLATLCRESSKARMLIAIIKLNYEVEKEKREQRKIKEKSKKKGGKKLKKKSNRRRRR